MPPPPQPALHPGHPSRPDDSNSSTPAASLPTVSTAPPCASAALPAARLKDDREGRSPSQSAHAVAGHKKGQATQACPTAVHSRCRQPAATRSHGTSPNNRARQRPRPRRRPQVPKQSPDLPVRQERTAVRPIRSPEPAGRRGTPRHREGPLDAIAVATAGQGRFAGLSPCGTALTTRHLTALTRSADLRSAGVLVAFDNDPAGQHAATRAYHLLCPRTGNTDTVSFQPGQDPARLHAVTGPPALYDTLANHTYPLADVVIDTELRRGSHGSNMQKARSTPCVRRHRLSPPCPPPTSAAKSPASPSAWA